MVQQPPVCQKIKIITMLYSFLLPSFALKGRLNPGTNLLCEYISATSIQKEELPKKCEVADGCQNRH